MKIFYCRQCNTTEVLTDNTIEVQHVHHTSPNAGMQLAISRPPIWMRDTLLELDPNDPMAPSIQEVLNKNFVIQLQKEIEEKYSEKYLELSKRLNAEIAIKALKQIKFEENGVYMMLVDPSMIDIEALATIDMSDFPVFNVVFIPVHIPPGKSLEDAMIIKETVENICDWLGKTMKCKILLIPIGDDAL